MPKEYTECVKQYIGKGVSQKTAKSRCAAMYYKRHGFTVKEAHEKGIAELPEDIRDGLDWELSLLIMTDLDELGAMKATEVTATKKADTHGSILDVVAINAEFIDDFGVVEIISTMVGAHAYTGMGEAVRWTQEGLESALPGWKFSRASINHNEESHGKVLAAFMEGKLVKMVVKVDDLLVSWIKRIGDMIGVSIEACDVNLVDSDIVKAKGCGVTFVFPPHEPACDAEEGCGIVGGEADDTENDADIRVVTDPETSEPPVVESDATYNNTEEQLIAVKEELGDEMSDEQIKTICAEVHEKMKAEKDSQIEAQTKEIESLKTIIASYETEKRDTMMNELKELVDAEPYKDKTVDELALVLEAVKAFKKKSEDEPIVTSGAIVNVEATDSDTTGNVLSNQLDEATVEADKAEKEVDAIWAQAKKFGRERPKKE